MPIWRKSDSARRFAKHFAQQVRPKAEKVEVFVYRGKNKIAGPFKSHIIAIDTATELIGKGYKFNKFQEK